MVDLSLQGVSKKYLVRQEENSAKSANPIARIWRRTKQREFWALRDISFEVPTGQALGIIGHNGAGKSTLLKLLSCITAPSAGEMRVHGRLAALLEVGSGFHPELTGRENVFLSGSILGMKRREIRAKLDAIVDFAEVRPFIDVPIKRYSSGMLVRLGFAIAAHLNPDVLLLDEVLAVGDVAFQSRCIERVLELRRSGVTIVFISHDLNAVERLCERVLLLQSGRIEYDGAASAAIAEYRNRMRFHVAPASDTDCRVAPDAEITAVQILNSGGAPSTHFDTRDAMRVRIDYIAHTEMSRVGFAILFWGAAQNLHCVFSTWLYGEPLELEPGRGAIEFSCEELCLLPGPYIIDAQIEQHGGSRVIDRRAHCTFLEVIKARGVPGVFYHPHSWRVVSLSNNRVA